MKRTKVFKVTIAITCVAAGSKFFRIQSIPSSILWFWVSSIQLSCVDRRYERPT